MHNAYCGAMLQRKFEGIQIPVLGSSWASFACAMEGGHHDFLCILFRKPGTGA